MSISPSAGEPAGDHPPRLPVSVSALITDGGGRLLILKPTYKSGWTIPGGQMEADGETPWDTCRREVREECALAVRTGRLVCVDFLRPRPDRAGGLRILFDCGSIADAQKAAMVLPPAEIAALRFVDDVEADELLRPAVRRRVGAVRARAARGPSTVVYLEDGLPIDAVPS